MRRYFFCFLFVAPLSTIFAQTSIKDLERHFSELHKGGYDQLPASVYEDERNAGKLLRILTTYLDDTLAHVRSSAGYLTKQIGLRSADPLVRIKSISLLITLLRDENTAVQDEALNGLCQFEKASFLENHKDLLNRYFIEESMPSNALIKLTGFLELTGVQMKLNNIALLSVNVHQKWTARVALARMGDKDAIRYLRNKLQRALIDDDFVYEILPDLIYTRQTEVFRFLEALIHNTEKNCHSADPDSGQKIECAYRVAEAIAPAIVGFPFSVDPSGDLNTANYPEALASIRTWLLRNHEYKIDRKGY
jgi:hypothetical protein